MDRRGFLAAGLGAAALASGAALPAAALADGGATRVFRIMRDGKDIGRHSLSARRMGDRFEIDIDIDIRVRLLGITAYRYEMTNREVWQGGRILSVNSRTNDDGDDDYVTIAREGERLSVDGTGYSGDASIDAVTTTYYVPGFIQRRPWLSSQSGQQIAFDATPTAEAPRTYRLTGEIENQLIYDDAGEWIGCLFDAGGEEGSYEVIEAGAVAALWRAAA